MIKIVYIGGNGWLGKYTQETLKEYSVLISSRNSLLNNQFKFSIGQSEIPEADLYLFTVPPSKYILKDFYRTIEQINKSSRLIFTSSTSVYSSVYKNCTEDLKLIKDSSVNETVFESETFISAMFNDYLILRLAGLAGENRYPAQFLTGKKNVSNGRGPVNLVQGEDVAALIKLSIEKDLKGIYNICCDEHPTRKDFYTKACEKAGLPIPHFIDNLESEKIIDNSKIKNALNYQFKYPSPYNMI